MLKFIYEDGGIIIVDVVVVEIKSIVPFAAAEYVATNALVVAYGVAASASSYVVA